MRRGAGTPRRGNSRARCLANGGLNRLRRRAIRWASSSSGPCCRRPSRIRFPARRTELTQSSCSERRSRKRRMPPKVSRSSANPMVLGELSDTSSADRELFVLDGIVPFTITEPDARERVTRWIRRTWFLPSGLAQRVRDDAIKQLYRPYWLFDAHAVGYWSAAGVTRGIIEMDFSNLLISGERGADPNELFELEPAAVKAIRPYALREIGLIAVADAPRSFVEATSLAHAR